MTEIIIGCFIGFFLNTFLHIIYKKVLNSKWYISKRDQLIQRKIENIKQKLCNYYTETYNKHEPEIVLNKMLNITTELDRYVLKFKDFGFLFFTLDWKEQHSLFYEMMYEMEDNEGIRFAAILNTYTYNLEYKSNNFLQKLYFIHCNKSYYDITFLVLNYD